MAAKEIVLLGGGHSHVEVLRAFGQQARLDRHQGGWRGWLPPQIAQHLQEQNPCPQPYPFNSYQHHPQHLDSAAKSGGRQAQTTDDEREKHGLHPPDTARKKTDMPVARNHHLTLISRGRFTPYSGMLPGWAAGFYSYEECHIDLQRLASYARARLVLAEANGIDTQTRTVLLCGSGYDNYGSEEAPLPPVAVPYDVLSIDVGISPGSAAVQGADRYVTPVKPIDGFVRRYEELLKRYRAVAARSVAAAAAGPVDLLSRNVAEGLGLDNAEAPALRVCVVGGGAGGVELAAAVRHRLEEERRLGGWAVRNVSASVSLVCRGSLLPGHPPHVRHLVRKLLAQRGVEVRCGEAVVGVEPTELVLASGGRVPYDECLWCTEASPAPWLRQTGLPVDAAGFLIINDRLQSEGGPPEVFAAGDVASCTAHPRPKAGVFAVRQGPPLSYNLQAFFQGRSLRPFIPQQTALALISLGDRFCVASRTGSPPVGSNSRGPSRANMATATASTALKSSSNRSDVSSICGDSAVSSRGCCAAGNGAKVGGCRELREEDEREWILGWLLNGFGGLLVCVTGPLLWRWKDAIDRAFMRKYGDDLDDSDARGSAAHRS